MQKLKKIFSRQNGLVLLLVLVEFMVLALYALLFGIALIVFWRVKKRMPYDYV